MDNVQLLINKWVVITAALIVMYYSFKSLNQCDKTTSLLVRIPLIIFLPAALGALIYAKSDAPIHWSYTLVILGIAAHFIGNRRSVRHHHAIQ